MFDAAPSAANRLDVAPAPEVVRRRAREMRRVVDSIRVVISCIALLMVMDFPPGEFTGLTVAARMFAIYSAVLLVAGARGSRLSDHAAVFWIDTLWLLSIFWLSGASTRYFQLLFFPVLFAGLRVSVRESVMVAIFSAGLAFVVLGLQPEPLNWMRTILLPLSLLALGPLVAILTRGEAVATTALTFAAELARQLDPRRGVESLSRITLDRVSTLFGAQNALLALKTHDGRCRVFVWERDESVTELSPTAAAAVAEQLFSCHLSFSYAAARWPRSLRPQRVVIGEQMRNQHSASSVSKPVVRGREAELAALIESSNMLAGSGGRSEAASLRLLLGQRERPFDEASLEALQDVLGQVFPVFENASLLEQLAAEAAATERARIGRDLHDSAIQPYIGLKFAIEAFARRVSPQDALADDVQRLLAMMNDELASLRDVVSGLRGAPGSGDALLVSAVKRQAERFAELFGIEVHVSVQSGMPVSRRLSGELFHMVSEGLSNIRRHTRSRRACVSLAMESDVLVLKISNESLKDEPLPAAFQPGSLAERAAALGGSAEVEIDDKGTTITIRVPIRAGESK